MLQYQWEILARHKKPRKNIKKFEPSTGPRVVQRNKDGTARTIEFRLYTGKKAADIYLVGEFSSWKKSLAGDIHQLAPISKQPGYFSVRVGSDIIAHNQPYGFLVDGRILRDPACVYFDKDGNSVFWDFEDPGHYQFSYPAPDKINRSVKILQTDLVGLIYHFSNSKKKYGNQIKPEEYYRFVADSGVIKRIKALGFNTIQFLPVSQAIDGDKWSFRYLIPYLRAIQSRWGSPDDFRLMIDAFHKEGIAVILDLVISHVPHKKFRLFGHDSRHIGIHHWKAGRKSIFLSEETPWGTMRYDIDNPEVRRFISDSAISYIKHYNIDGYRIDNVDGIIREGQHGEGNERKNGRKILRELNKAIYAYAPHTYVHYEAHYFHEANAKWLTTPIASDPKALGATAYNSSRLTYYFHKEFMPKSADEISPWRIKHIIEEKEWGASNSTVADFHNHDAAAGLMPMRATGSYAYDAMILNKPDLHFHAVGKIKVMEGLISFGMEGRTLDLLQTHILQCGTFEHDLSIHWHLAEKDDGKKILDFKKAVNGIMDQPAFWPKHVRNRQYINVDEPSKTLVIVRTDPDNQFIVLINMSAFVTEDYVVPVPDEGSYKLILNSDKAAYAGEGTRFETTSKSVEVDLFQYFKYGLRLHKIPAYGVLVWKKKTS